MLNYLTLPHVEVSEMFTIPSFSLEALEKSYKNRIAALMPIADQETPSSDTKDEKLEITDALIEDDSKAEDKDAQLTADHNLTLKSFLNKVYTFCGTLIVVD